MKRVLLFSTILLLVLSCRRSGMDVDVDQNLAISVMCDNGYRVMDDVLPGSTSEAYMPSSADGFGWKVTTNSEWSDKIDSRATETAFQKSDAVGLFIHAADVISSTGNHTSNLKYVTADGSKWQSAGALGGGLIADKYTVTSYYPYRSGVTNPTAMSVEVDVDQSSVAPADGTAGVLEQSDFMSAKAVMSDPKGAKPSAALNFSHRLSKLVVVIGVPSLVNGSPVTSDGIKSVTLKNIVSKLTYNLATDAVTLGADKVDVLPRCVMSTDGTKKMRCEAIVPPQTIAGGVMLVDIKIATDAGEQTLSYTVPAASSTTFKAGEKTTLTLSSSADLSFVSELELLDGLAVSDTTLVIKAASTIGTWVLTSPATWLTLCKTKAGTYGPSIEGAATGADEIVYVKVAANNTVADGSWKPRQAALTLAQKSTPAVNRTYTVIQNYNRFEVSAEAIDVTREGDATVFSTVTSNQIWQLRAPADMPDWIRITTAKVAWNKVTAGNTVAFPFDVVGGMANTGYYVVCASNTKAGSPARSASFTCFVNGTTAKTIKITQASADPFAMPAGASNSYMVAPGGTLAFNALQMKAYFSTPNATPASVQVLWQTAVNHGTSAGATNMILNTVAYNSTTGDVNVTTRGGSGNAVLAAYTGANGTGTILWSWHVWVTATPGHSQTLPVGNQAAAGGPGKLFMDRNLGAITNAQGNVGAYGMFYQWGRKDPFTPSIGANTSNQSLGVVQVFNASGALISTSANGLGSSFKYLASNADNLLSSIKDPMTHYYNNDGSWTSNTAACNNYWRAPATAPANAGYIDNRGDSKGIYDPCPQGYRIAANGAYAGCTGTTWAAYNPAGGTNWLGVWWPAAGYRNPGSGAFNYAGVGGYVWSSSPSAAANGYYLYFDYLGNVGPSGNGGRGYGFSVRCVQE